MVQYYNMTKFSTNEGFVSFYRNVSFLTNEWFGIMLVFLMFILPLITLIKRGNDVNTSINYSSLFATLLAVFLYIAQIINKFSLAIYIPALIYTVTLVIRWYNK